MDRATRFTGYLGEEFCRRGIWGRHRYDDTETVENCSERTFESDHPGALLQSRRVPTNLLTRTSACGAHVSRPETLMEVPGRS
jgi:hypothetical protein